MKELRSYPQDIIVEEKARDKISSNDTSTHKEGVLIVDYQL